MLRPKAQHEHWHGACELRSRILAARAGAKDAYKDEDDYAILEDRSEEYLDNNGKLFETRADDVLGTVGVEETSECSDDHVENVLGTVGTDKICVDLNLPTDDLETEADRVAGCVVDDQELIEAKMDRHYGVDREPVSLDPNFSAAGRLVENADRAVTSDIRSHIDFHTGELNFVSHTESVADAHVSGVSSATDLHKSLFGAIEGQMQDLLLDAAVEVAHRVGHGHQAFVDVLDAVVNPEAPPQAGAFSPDVSRSADGLFASLLERALSGDSDEQFREFVSQLGGNTFADVRTSIQDVVEGPLAVFRAASVTPEVVVSLPSDLFEWKAETRQNLIEYVAALGKGCDLKVVASPFVQQRIIWETDPDILPEGVAESAIARHTDRVDDDQMTADVDDARSEIKLDSGAWDILQYICEGRTNQARYGSGSDLLADERIDYDRSSVSTFVSTLETHGLVNVHGPQNDKYAVATEIGIAALNTVRPLIGKQSQLDSFELAPNQSGVENTLDSDADLCTPEQGRQGGTGLTQTAQTDNSAGATAGSSSDSSELSDRKQALEAHRDYSTGHADVEPLTQWEHDAVVGSCTQSTIALDNVAVSGVNKDSRIDGWTVDRLDDKRSPLYSYRKDRDEFVVGAEFHGPLQTPVTLARGLLSDLAFEQLLTADRLDGVAGDLDALIGGDKHTLRNKRCLGWLKNTYDGEGYQQALREAREDLCELLYYHKHADFETESDKYDFRGEIMRFAHGLIGTATGIYDLLDVDLYRTIRIPGDVKRNLSPTDCDELKHTLVRAMTISSKMGVYTQSRVHFDPRHDKRAAIGAPPEVDAADPTGTHIGSWSIVGHDADTLQPELQDALENPEQFDLQYQDYDEYFTGFFVDYEITAGMDRETITATLKRGLEARNMQPTSHAVSVMQAFCGSPHDIAKAISRLGNESRRREVRVDDLKYGLKHLPPTRIAPEAPTTKSKLLYALIRAHRPLTQTELCEKADVWEGAFAGWGDNRAHGEELAAFDLIRETEDGWAVCLRYKDADLDTDDDALPWYAKLDEERSSRDQTAEADKLREESMQGALYEAMLVLEDASTFSQTDHPLTDVIHGRLTSEDLDRLLTCRPGWTGLVYAIVAFRENDPLAIGDESVLGPQINIRSDTMTATTGKPPDQKSVKTF